MKHILSALALVALAGTAQAADPTGNKLADEVNATSLQFTLTQSSSVSFGLVGGTWTAVTLSPGKYACTARTFGIAEGSGSVRRQCKLTADPVVSPDPTALAVEDANFTLAATTAVKFGAIGVGFYQKTVTAGTYACARSFFDDPAPGVAKKCYVAPAGDPAPQSPNQSGTPVVVAPTPSTLLTGQSGTFTIVTPTAVKYGGNGLFVQKTLIAGEYPCSDGFFTDPAPGVVKACYTVGTDAASPPQSTDTRGTAGNPYAGATPPVVVPPVEPTTPPVGFDAAAYRAQAALFGTTAGLPYKFGAASTVTVNVTQPGPRPSKSMQPLSTQNNVTLADGVKGNRACFGDGWCGTYQYGTLFGNPGDFSSSIINVGFVPTSPKPSVWPQPKYFGVMAIQSIAVAHNSISVSPENLWTTYDYDTGAPADSGGTNNDPNTKGFADGSSPLGAVPIDSKPTATFGGIGRGGWTNNAMTAWSNGWITSSGSNTSRNWAKVKLADGKVPTGGTISNSGEFMFVTVWDTTNLKGQLAVVAMKDGCQGCFESDENSWYRNWGSAKRAFAGFPGLGNYVGGKVLGYIDLPDEMKTPTDVSASTGRSNDDYQIVRNFWDDDIQVQANRTRLYSGDKRTAMANTGMAVVIDKVAQRAAFIDLRPMMTYYREQYLAPQSDAQFAAKVANRGDGDNQFPPTFTGYPAQKPVVVKVVTLSSKPTTVKLTLHEPHRAVIATEDGTARIYGVGSKYLDQVGTQSGVASDITELFTYAVGTNPTNITHMKEKANLGPNGASSLFGTAKFDDFMFVLSRGEKKISLLQWNADRTSLSTYRTLQDTRMTDPYAMDDTANHGTESFSLIVGNGNGDILSYRYGPMTMWTYDPATAPCPRPNGCSMLNGAQFEYNGKARVPGIPFNMHGANIN